MGLLVVAGIGGSVLSCSGLGVHNIDGVCVWVGGVGSWPWLAATIGVRFPDKW